MTVDGRKQPHKQSLNWRKKGKTPAITDPGSIPTFICLWNTAFWSWKATTHTKANQSISSPLSLAALQYQDTQEK